MLFYDLEFMDKDLLKSLRNQIDTIDEEIIYLLSRRFEIVKQIGLIKKKNNIEILQSERWNSLMENLFQEALDKWVSKELVRDIWHLIHKESLNLEK